MNSMRLFLVVLVFTPVYLFGLNALSVQRVYELVLKQLAGKSVPKKFVQKIFFDKRTTVEQELNTKKGRIKQFAAHDNLDVGQEQIMRGSAFYTQYEVLLKSIAHSYHIDPFIILAIIGVETNYGTFMGRYRVFNVLYTQAATEPARRDEAVMQLAEFLQYCYERGIDPHSIVGSCSGAFGYGQFKARGFNYYGVSHGNKKQAFHDSWPDTIASIANYLKAHGYRDNKQAVHKALYAYNPSNKYVALVIKLRDLLAKELS